MYNYKAIILRIVDGDTVDAQVDVGFSIFINHRFRIHNFDAPESYRPKTLAEKEHGEVAKLKAMELLEGKLLQLPPTSWIFMVDIQLILFYQMGAILLQ